MLLSSVFAITEMMDLGLYVMPLSMSVLSFGMGTMLPNFYMCIMLVLRAVVNMVVRNAIPRRPMGFRCLMLNLSSPCELLFLLCSIPSWISVVGSVMLYHLFFSVNGYVCPGCCVFYSVCELFGETLGNIFECGGALQDRPCTFFSSKECVW